MIRRLDAAGELPRYTRAAPHARAQGLAVTADGSTLYIADFTNKRILKVDVATGTATTEVNSLSGPHGVALGADGATLFIADGDKIVKYVPGEGRDYVATGLTLAKAVAVDSAGTVFFSDAGTHTVHKIALDGTVSVIAGTAGVSGLSGDDGAATSAQLSYPRGLDIDTTGALFIADAGNKRIRKIAGVAAASGAPAPAPAPEPELAPAPAPGPSTDENFIMVRCKDLHACGATATATSSSCTMRMSELAR